MEKGTLIVNSLLEWHKKNRRVFPWRKERDPYIIFIAEFLLQRTPAERVALFLPKFLEEFPSPEKLANAEPTYLERLCHSMGLKKRMLWLIKSMKIVCQKYNSKIPETFEELVHLPGVGEYTASAILCFGFGRDIPIIDTNVVRVYTRLFGLSKSKITGNTAIKEVARMLLPKNQAKIYNEAILDFASLICMKIPHCERCPLNALCSFFH